MYLGPKTRLPLRPSTNMSHTTYVKHTGYQVNIIHHESHVSSNNKQYSTIHMPMSYSTPKPCGWQCDPTQNRHQLRGWVGGKLSCRRLPFGARSKSASSIGVRTACSNTDAGPAVPAVLIASALYRRHSVGTRARPSNSIPLLSLAQANNKSEPESQ